MELFLNMPKKELTKDLSSSEYNGLPWNLEDAIKAQVNREENKWFKKEPQYIPKVEKPRKVEFTAGVFNMLKQILP